jgi:hypothetical protein
MGIPDNAVAEKQKASTENQRAKASTEIQRQKGGTLFSLSGTIQNIAATIRLP